MSFTAANIPFGRGGVSTLTYEGLKARPLRRDKTAEQKKKKKGKENLKKRKKKRKEKEQKGRKKKGRLIKVLILARLPEMLCFRRKGGGIDKAKEP